MSASSQTVCAACGAVNRFPVEKLSEARQAKCARCKAALFSGRAEPLSPNRFDRFVGAGDIPVLVDFWAPWCGPCRALGPVLERAAAALSPEIRVAKVNMDEAQALAGRLNVRAVPTLALYARGRELGRTSGLMDEGALVRWARSTASTGPA